MKKVLIATESRTLQPAIGQIVGRRAGGALSGTAAGSVSSGNLKTVTWKTGIWPFQTTHKHNQALYVSNGTVGWN